MRYCGSGGVLSTAKGGGATRNGGLVVFRDTSYLRHRASSLYCNDSILLYQGRKRGIWAHVKKDDDDHQTGGNEAGGEKEKQSLVSKIFQLPLEIASTLSKEDAHYLEKRGRKRWWKRMSFPKVPSDTLDEAHATAPPLSVWMKVIPLGAIFFGASFNLAILQSLKDSIMVTTAGAETLPFLASFVVLPISLGFFVMYGKMIERLPSRMIFYVAILPLILFYIFFTTVLYPNHMVLHPNWLVDAASAYVPQGTHRACQGWSVLDVFVILLRSRIVGFSCDQCSVLVPGE